MSKKQTCKVVLRDTPPACEIPSRIRRWWTWGFLGLCSSFILLVFVVSSFTRPTPVSIRRPTVTRAIESAAPGGRLELEALCSLSAAELEDFDLATLNLACLDGLPGGEKVQQERCLELLERCAASVRSQTESNLHRFYSDPGAYNNSEAYFRMLMLVTVLQQDFGVRYNPSRINEVDYRIPADLFLHGLLGYGKGGTCVSIPSLYTTVAQRLGYPVSLVYAKQHLFCRWDGQGTRFNIEGTNQGMSVYPDEHYMQWPGQIQQEEVDSGQYLRTLNKRECLAAFVAMRAHCLEDLGQTTLALNAYRQATALAPDNRLYQSFLHHLSRQRVVSMLEKLQEHADKLDPSSADRRALVGRDRNITADDIKRLADSGFSF